MGLATLAANLEADAAHHQRDVLSDAGIESELVPSAGGATFDVSVDEADLETAKQLFADPFAEDDAGGADEEALPAPVAPLLEPGDRTELLARTTDYMAAERLVHILHSAGLYALNETSGQSSVFGIEGLPAANVMIATRQRDRAFAELEAYAREHTKTFEGAVNITPSDVVEALLLALTGKVRIREG